MLKVTHMDDTLVLGEVDNFLPLRIEKTDTGIVARIADWQDSIDVMEFTGVDIMRYATLRALNNFRKFKEASLSREEDFSF